jgi:hypothetical protein
MLHKWFVEWQDSEGIVGCGHVCGSDGHSRGLSTMRTLSMWSGGGEEEVPGMLCQDREGLTKEGVLLRPDGRTSCV